MAVKRIRGVSRGLEVLEAVARHQPVSVGELSRQLGENKSTLQRVLMTLGDDGWIRQAPGPVTSWELTARIFALVNMGQGHTELRHRARAGLDRLCSETGESVFLAVPDRERMVTIDVLESSQMLRTAPYIGMIIPVRNSAAGKAVLAAMPPEQQVDLLGCVPDAELRKELVGVRERGYSVNDGAVVDGSVNVGASILGPDGDPIAAVVVSAPKERMSEDARVRIGQLLVETVQPLSSVM